MIENGFNEQLFYSLLGNVTQTHYSRILSRDIAKLLCDNLKQRYPALTENTVPENISYGCSQMC